VSAVVSVLRDRRPGLDARRVRRLMRAAVRELDLDLRERVVVTEAATGPYAVTPVIAALAGAPSVYAVAGDSRFGSAADACAYTHDLATAAGVLDQIELVLGKERAPLEEADIVTNSGHVRPLDADAVGRMRHGAAIPLMYEAWELRPGEVDLRACARRGVRVAGTNERHPAVDVFSYLGPMAVKLLMDAGVPVSGTSLLLLCDNPFGLHIARGLTAAGAHVDIRRRLGAGPIDARWDAVVVALQPGPGPVLGAEEGARLAERAPGTLLAQFWGDVDREALADAGVPMWPPAPPAPGHMAILPSGLGPDPIVRLQAGGLKVGEVLCRADDPRAGDADYVDPV
jgi:hypothetical protein